jgi:predicted Zn-dependent protease
MRVGTLSIGSNVSLRRKSPERLWNDVEWAMSHGLGPGEVVPMLERLVWQTVADSTPGRHARTHLGALLVTRSPWKAARLAHEVIRHVDDSQAWAVLGLAHTLLGHYRSALRAYRRSLALDPSDPALQHNYGHLLDVIFDRPHDALRYLRAACRALPNEPEVIASYARALARVGNLTEARRWLGRSLPGDHAAVEAWLVRWQRPRVENSPRSAETARNLGPRAVRRKG